MMPSIVDRKQTIFTVLILWFAGTAIWLAIGVAISSKISIAEVIAPLLYVFFALVMFTPILGYLLRTEQSKVLIGIFFEMACMIWIIGFVNGELTSLNSCCAAFRSFVCAGMTEELFKMLVYITPFIWVKLSNGYQLIYYAALSGICFGINENAVFVLSNDSKPSMIAFTRALSLTLLHCILCMIGAIFIVYKKAKIVDSFFMYILAYLVPVVLHGLYNYSVLANWENGVHLIIYIATVIIAFALFLPVREPMSEKNTVKIVEVA